MGPAADVRSWPDRPPTIGRRRSAADVRSWPDRPPTCAAGRIGRRRSAADNRTPTTGLSAQNIRGRPTRQPPHKRFSRSDRHEYYSSLNPLYCCFEHDPQVCDYRPDLPTFGYANRYDFADYSAYMGLSARESLSRQDMLRQAG